MTFTIKHKRADRPMVAEYTCPEHGKFAREVDRDENGDPPAELPCRVEVERYDGVRRSLVTYCGLTSPFTISAPRVGVRRVEAVRGGWEKPARKTFLDTRDLGEGQDPDEWRENRAAIRDEDRRQHLKELIDDAPY